MPLPAINQVTPMMQQYLQIKLQYPDEILFYRLGDFYEMFFDDAILASRELELTLTGRDCGMEQRAPMCGVPYHAVDTYIARLIAKGYRIAICEQMEDPALAKGLVKREIIRIVTPGTVTDESSLSEKKNNYLASVCFEGKRVGLAWTDVTTGEFNVRSFATCAQNFASFLGSISPKEIITNGPQQMNDLYTGNISRCDHSFFQSARSTERLLRHFNVSTLGALGLDNAVLPAAHAAGALLGYLDETQKNAMEHITALHISDGLGIMPLDSATRRNLELTEGLHSHMTSGSLLGILDETCTAMGGRTLRRWVEQPLLRKEDIESRLNAVEALFSDLALTEKVRNHLSNVYDIERILSKISYGTINPRDCLALERSLAQIPALNSLLSREGASALSGYIGHIDPCEDVTALISSAIDESAPIAVTDGHVIRDGYDQELDGYRAASSEGHRWLAQMENEERDRTGIRNLRIEYNRVFGYYIEVTKSYLNLVPPEYRRRQTLANSERFTTDALHKLEESILNARENALRKETELFGMVKAAVRTRIDALQRTAEAVKKLDALQAFARVSLQNRYCKPRLNDEGLLQITAGRHPVVECTQKEQVFIPNDTVMNRDSRSMQIITGPNMAGKSTYMRQVALIVLMAHIGCFVPADEAFVPLVDNIYTRVGASDDLASGQSTFMVEMSETAFILRNATRRSLIILDEIGRGTSTFDGLSIAWACVEYLSNKSKCGALTLFATHYHELSELEGVLENVENYQVSVKEHGEEVIFLRKIIRGGADKSFGIYVAQLAGLPREVIARAREIEARLDANHINQNTIGKNILEKNSKKSQQQDLFNYAKTELIDELANLDVLSMSPIDALNTLFLMREKARTL